MHDQFAPTMPLMPSWLVAPAVVVLLAVGALHVWHARSADRLTGWWHGAHVAMVAGMVVMFLVPVHDGGLSGVLFWWWAAVFGAHAAAMALSRMTSSQVASRPGASRWGSGAARTGVWQSGAFRWAWGAAIVDQLIMAFMLMPLAERPAALTYPAVAYLAVAAAAWLRIPRRLSRTGGLTVLDGRPTAHMTTSAATSIAAPRVSVRAATCLTTGVRLTLAVMAVSMAWMLVAMQVAGAHGAMVM